jgi:hypothetical protein
LGANHGCGRIDEMQGGVTSGEGREQVREGPGVDAQFAGVLGEQGVDEGGFSFLEYEDAVFDGAEADEFVDEDRFGLAGEEFELGGFGYALGGFPVFNPGGDAQEFSGRGSRPSSSRMASDAGLF